MTKSEKKKDLLLRLRENNYELANLLQTLNIHNLQLTSLGNSIASGYSMADNTKPLLLRNDSLSEIMNYYGIDLCVNHFARPQTNNDDQILEWFVNNISASHIYEKNRIDYGNLETSMPFKGMTNKDIDTYFPLNPTDNPKLQDLCFKKNDNLANIIIYNGCTGSFLDNLTRQGTIPTKGFKKDFISFEAILKLIQLKNRQLGTNTQIYVCGVPKILGITATSINSKMKSITNFYSCASYVDSIIPQSVYFSKYEGKPLYNSFGRLLTKIPFQFDFHYNEIEYLKLLNNIIISIINNYLFTQATIDIDRKLSALSNEIEMNEYMFDKTINRMIEEEVQNIINNWKPILKNNGYNIDIFIKQLKNYLLSRFQYDYYYIGKKEILKSLSLS